MFITITQTGVLLVLKDEGRGFLLDTSIRIPSIGLQSMKDRAKAAGGTVDWTSQIEKGTELLIRIPY